MPIHYQVNAPLTPEELSEVFERSGIRRPVGDLPRLEKMIAGANLVVTARDGGRLVGVARALTDFIWCCYLSDLAVDRTYQRQGIGRELLRLVQMEVGEQTTLLLVAAPEAADYYPYIGLERVDSAWMIRRAR